MMPDPLSLVVATLSLIISGATLWFTVLRRGSVRMTQPTTIFFGPDSERSQKVYIRTLLYSTSSRGQVVENAFLRLRHEDSVQTFNVWVLGEAALARGSGLYVGSEGITCNHHFLLPKGSPRYYFQPGEYQIEVYVSLVGDRSPHLLSALGVTITDQQSRALSRGQSGIYFDWDPDIRQYSTHIDSRPSPEELFLRQLERGRAT